MTTNNFFRVFVFVLMTIVLNACATTGQDFETSEDLFEEEQLLTFNELLIEGDAAVASGDLDSAQVNYAIAIEQQPDNVQALYKMGFVHFKKSSLEVSERVLNRTLQIDPNHQASMQTLAMVLLQLEQPDEAEFYLTRLIEINPNSWEALSTLGALRDIQGRHQEAQTLFQDALRIQPRSPKIQNNLGYSYYLAGDFRKAEDHYQQALRYSPEYERAWSNLALVYSREGRHQESAAAFNKIVSKKQTANNLGYLGLLSGDDELAREQLNQAVKLSASYYDRAQRNLDSLDNRERNSTNKVVPLTQTTSDKSRPVDRIDALASERTARLQTVTIGSPAPAPAPTTTKINRSKSLFLSNIEIQYYLNLLGYSSGTPDGRFGSQTRAAVRDFQRVYGLTVDGQVGPQTLDVLVKNTRSAIREKLRSLGFGADDDTEAPLKTLVTEFQRSVDLPRDGLISPQLIEALNKAKKQAIRNLDPWHNDVPASRG